MLYHIHMDITHDSKIPSNQAQIEAQNLQMSTASMASAISTPTCLCQSSSSSIIRKPTFYTLSTSVNSISNTPNFRLSTWNHQLGLAPFSQWHGLRHLGISISQHFVRLGTIFHLGIY